MISTTDLFTLKSEYGCLVAECTDQNGAVDWNLIRERLVRDAEWTPHGAAHLVQLAQEYGSLVLRNAAALAIAAHVEDGELGL